MSTGTVMSIITVVIMACFILVVLYAFVYRGSKDFEDQAHIPLEDDQPVDDKEQKP